MSEFIQTLNFCNKYLMLKILTTQQSQKANNFSFNQGKKNKPSGRKFQKGPKQSKQIPTTLPLNSTIKKPKKFEAPSKVSIPSQKKNISHKKPKNQTPQSNEWFPLQKTPHDFSQPSTPLYPTTPSYIPKPSYSPTPVHSPPTPTYPPTQIFSPSISPFPPSNIITPPKNINQQHSYLDRNTQIIYHQPPIKTDNLFFPTNRHIPTPTISTLHINQQTYRYKDYPQSILQKQLPYKLPLHSKITKPSPQYHYQQQSFFKYNQGTLNQSNSKINQSNSRIHSPYNTSQSPTKRQFQLTKDKNRSFLDPNFTQHKKKLFQNQNTSGSHILKNIAQQCQLTSQKQHKKPSPQKTFNTKFQNPPHESKTIKQSLNYLNQVRQHRNIYVSLDQQ